MDSTDFYQKTIKEFFSRPQKSYTIPTYQRAYSWEKAECDVFLNDLLEHIEGDNNYFYGNIILEEKEKDAEYEIVDGQQRLMTLIIFIRAMINVLEKIKDPKDLVEIDVDELTTIFLKDTSTASETIKLRPVDYDQSYFDSLIIKNEENSVKTTPSQDRIKEAKEFFTEELEKLDTNKLPRILNKIKNTDLTVLVLKNKKDSALMFELQNNRGKDLTDMEKLKSYLMYQMHIYSEQDATESNIDHVSRIFNKIYQIINDIKLKEDDILRYHNQSLRGNYDDKKSKSLVYEKEYLKKSEDKVTWIKDYTSELLKSFEYMKEFATIHSNIPYAKKLSKLSKFEDHPPVFIYPFILRGYKYMKNDKESDEQFQTKLNTLCHILEIVAFRHKLINTGANVNTRLNKPLLNFTGDLVKLKGEKDSGSEGIYHNHFGQHWEVHHWGDIRMKDQLNGWMYERKSALKYLLGEYENSIQNKGYSVEVSLKDTQIEHISPQTPPHGEPISTGYDVDENNEYPEDFKNDWLHSLGNLMLIPKSHNASIGNKAFSEKLASYEENLLRQQAEIKDFATVKNGFDCWTTESIKERHERLVDFAMDEWSFDNVKIA